MNDDLISRSALKRELGYTDEWYNRRTIRELIDNAPTFPNEYMRGYEAAEREYKRPQGEWGKWIISVIQCPDCLECFNFPTRYYPMEMLKECPNCGANMIGGKE